MTGTCFGNLSRVMSRFVPCQDSTKYNDHLAEIAHFNTVPVPLTADGLIWTGLLADI